MSASSAGRWRSRGGREQGSGRADLPARPGAAGGRKGQSRPLCRVGAQAAARSKAASGGGVRAASFRPRPDELQGGGDLLVRAFGGRGALPDLAVRVPASGEGVSQRAVGCAAGRASVAAW